MIWKAIPMLKAKVRKASIWGSGAPPKMAPVSAEVQNNEAVLRYMRSLYSLRAYYASKALKYSMSSPLAISMMVSENRRITRTLPVSQTKVAEVAKT